MNKGVQFFIILSRWRKVAFSDGEWMLVRRPGSMCRKFTFKL
jgi:hypothetical protein